MRPGQWLGYAAALLIVIGGGVLLEHRIQQRSIAVASTTARASASAMAVVIPAPPPEQETHETISEAAPASSGRLDPTLMQHEIRKHTRDFARCYEEALARDPSAGGRMSMRFEIGRSGAVANAEVAMSDGTKMPPQLQRCLLAAVSKLKFPPPEGGTVRITYPIVLSPSD